MCIAIIQRKKDKIMGKQVNKINYDEYDNFIFDLYGTLIDLHTDEHCSRTWKAWMKMLNAKGIKHAYYPIFRHSFFKMDKEFRKIQLKTHSVDHPEIDVLDIYKILFKKYGNALNDKDIEDISYSFRCASIDYIRLYPNTIKYLDFLREKGKKIYILSNAQASYTRPEIVHFGLDKLVDDYYLSSDYGCMKPDIKYFNTIINDKKLDISRTIMIGDNMDSDINGALNAGLSAYQICNGDLFLKP